MGRGDYGKTPNVWRPSEVIQTPIPGGDPWTSGVVTTTTVTEYGYPPLGRAEGLLQFSVQSPATSQTGTAATLMATLNTGVHYPNVSRMGILIVGQGIFTAAGATTSITTSLRYFNSAQGAETLTAAMTAATTAGTISKFVTAFYLFPWIPGIAHISGQITLRKESANFSTGASVDVFSTQANNYRGQEVHGDPAVNGITEPAELRIYQNTNNAAGSSTLDNVWVFSI